MKTLVLVLFSIITIAVHAQRRDKQLQAILASDTFWLQESYAGDWGGYKNQFEFVHLDTVVQVRWQFLDGSRDAKLYTVNLPQHELLRLGFMLKDCAAAIKASKRGSTEHVTYELWSSAKTYKLDDHTTLECDAEFREWKAMLVAAAKAGE